MTDVNTLAPLFLGPNLKEDRGTVLGYLVGFLLEFLLYGVYCCCFLASVFIICRSQQPSSLSSKILCFGNTLLFIYATALTALNFSILLQAFVYEPSSAASYPYAATSHWENLAIHILTYVAMNTGDILVIYRCYLIWSHNIYVVILPIVLLAISTGLGVVLFVAFDHPEKFSLSLLSNILLLVGSIHLTQNMMTTGLIFTRLWRQHRASSDAGVRCLGASLMRVGFIILESASIYTLELLALIILSVQGSRYVSILLFMVVPTVGLVFNVITVRVYLAQWEAAAKSPLSIILPRPDMVEPSSQSDWP